MRGCGEPLGKHWMTEHLDTAQVVERYMRRTSTSMHRLPMMTGPVAAAADLICDALADGGTVLACGNGGSAATAQHFVAEILCRFENDRDALPAISLSSDPSVVTAISNDLGFENLFARQVEGFARSGDVLVAFTTSGTSANVVNALATARARGVKTVAVVGGGEQKAVKGADLVVATPVSATPLVQEFHEVVIHALCTAVEVRLFGGRVPGLGSVESVVGLDGLATLAGAWSQAGLTVVSTNGVFDILHAGHVRFLREARSLGDVLVVGLNDDDSVRRLKGPERPINIDIERAEVLASLDPVDAVCIFGEDTPEAFLEVVRPNIHVKGSDYAPPGGRKMPETKVVEANGGSVAFIELTPERSTTRIVKRLSKNKDG